jgi:hypothetical protein
MNMPPYRDGTSLSQTVIANAIMTVPQDRADNKKYEVDE